MSDDLELLVESGPQTGNRHPLPASGQITVGRGDDCDIRFTNDNQMMISRRHVRIDIRSTGLFLTDLASGRGTKLDNQVASPGKEFVLEEGSRIQLGLPDGPVLTLRAAGSPSKSTGTKLVNQSAGKNLPQQLEILMQANRALESENQRLSEQHQKLVERSAALSSEKEQLERQLAATDPERAPHRARSSAPAERPAASEAEWERADELFGSFSKSLLDIKEALRSSTDTGTALPKVASAIFKLDNLRKYLQSLRSGS